MKKLLLLMFLFSTLVFACDKNDDPVVGEVEFFLLDSYETYGNTPAIDATTAVLENTPFLSYADLVSYNSETYTFELSAAGVEAVKDQSYPVDGKAFGVVANGNLIYTGYFWPSYSSMSCHWVVIDPTLTEINNQLRVRLGYPGEANDGSIPDERNEDVILDVFKRDGKLVE